MSLHTFGEHTVDAELLTPGGWVLDAGCRDFTFARELAARGCKVVAVDADPTVEDPQIDGITFVNSALCDVPGVRQFFMHQDPQARFVIDTQQSMSRPGVVVVEAVTIAQLMARFGVFRWDAIKLDIEGAEYGVLQNLNGPIAKQISIEFHEHVKPRPQALYDSIFNRLGNWYDVIQHAKERRHGCAPNFWDTLFILKPEN